MIKYLIALFFVAGTAQAWTATSLDHLSLDIHRFSANREPMTPEIEPSSYKGAVQLNWNVGLLNDYVKWDNKVYASGTYAKFTTVSWEYMLRIPTRFGIEPFISHKSQHTLDQEQPLVVGKQKTEKFPVRDAVGLRFVFFEKGPK